MVSRSKFLRLCTGLLPILIGVLAVGGLLLGAQPASAVDNCIQDVWKAHGNSQNLTCTANDVRIAEVTNITITSGGSCTGTPPNQVCTCNSPGNVTFSADYRVVLTAQTRYDVGLYFGVDGDPNGDGALTGQCQANIITQGEEVNPANFLQLDPSPDSCGDIDSAHNPQLLHLSLTVPCVGDPVTGKLKLPNCTSWRQPGSNDVCQTVNDAFPGSPSKCNCQPGFTINIFVEHPTISVDKTVVPTQVNEPGGTVTYTVKVTNNGTQSSVTLTSLTEDDTNDGTVDFTYNASSNPTLASICGTLTLAPGASTNCTFQRTVSGNAGDNITDKACVGGTDSNGGTVTPVCDTATVSIADVKPTAAVTKTVDKVVCAVIRYKVKVENTDLAESLRLSALTDDKVGGNGDITTTTGVHDNLVATTCAVPQTIAVGGNYQCTFDANVCTFPNTDTVTGTLNDNDGNTITPTGSATVTSVTAN